MKRLLVMATLGLGIALPGHGAEERFSKAVRPEDFSAAGLEKLSPAELERLDALVRAFRSRDVEAAGSEMPRANPGTMANETTPKSARPPETAPKKSSGLLAKAKVILAPGTEIEYSNVESRIAGEFRGWRSKTVFTLENGQRWQVDGGADYVGPPISNPAVKIMPGMLGTFWLYVEGVNQRVRVKLISTP